MSCGTNGSCGCGEVATAKRVENAPRSAETFRPEVDIYETAEEFVVRADVPGARPDSIDLNVEQGVLTLRAEVAPRTPENGRPLSREYAVGAFERSFRVGEGIDTERIGAELKDGVLTLRLPKAETVRGRKIKVQTAG